MAGFSNYLENAILDHILGGGDYTRPATVYVSLHTSDPGDTGANECSGASYARVAITNNGTNWPSASGGAKTTGAVVTFPTATGGGSGFGTVTHFGIWDASTSGNNLFSGALTSSQAVPSGVTVSFAIGDIDITLD